MTSKYIQKILPITVLVLFVLSSCTSSSKVETSTSKPRLDRNSGFQAPDGTYVGPRGDANQDGTPVGIGAYGKRKKHKGNLVINKNGTKISDIDVSGKILVNANNVSISNFTAEGVTQKPLKYGMVLEDGTIDGKQKKDDGIQWNNFEARRMDISGSFDGIKAQGNVVIEDSYIHDLYAFRGPDAGAGNYSHNDCVQISIGSNILIQRNWFTNCGFNAAVFIDPDQGKIDNVTVQYNYLDGGGITFYAIASRSAEFGVPTNVNVSNNVFGETHEFDYATVGDGIEFLDNVNTRGETVVPRKDSDNT